MNKDQLKKLVGWHVRIRPIAKRLNGIRELPEIDDAWVVTRVEPDLIELSNLRTAHAPTLGLDQIYSFMSDPGRDTGGIKYGFLLLRVQLHLLPHTVDIEPLPPGEWGEYAQSREVSRQQATERLIESLLGLESRFRASDRPFAFCWSTLKTTGQLQQWWIAAVNDSLRQEHGFRIREAGALLKQSEFFTSQHKEIIGEGDDGWRWCLAVMKLIKFQRGIHSTPSEHGIEYELRSIEDFGNASRLLCMRLVADERALR